MNKVNGLLAKRLILFIVLVVLIIPFINSHPHQANALESNLSNVKKTNSRVVVVSLPRVSWDMINGVNMPHLQKLIEVGSVGSLSVKTPGPDRSLETGYATISAGNRAFAVNSVSSTFLKPSEDVNGLRAQDIFEVERSKNLTNAAGLSLGFERTSGNRQNTSVSTEVGVFANALVSHNKSIGVYGNSDLCLMNEKKCFHRPVGYVGSNKNGVLKNGDISRDLLNKKGMLNYSRLRRATNKSLQTNAVTVVECSDLERIDHFSPLTKKSITEHDLDQSLKKCDDMIGEIVSKLDLTKDQIYVISPMSRRSKDELTIFVAAGKSINKGLASSGITRRKGIVALSDIAPSILDFYSIKPPATMVNTQIEYLKSDQSNSARIRFVQNINDGAQARDKAFNSASAVFILVVFLSCLITVAAYRFKRFRKIATFAGFTSIIMPTVSFLILPAMRILETPPPITAFFLAISLCLSALAYYVSTLSSLRSVILSIALFNLIFQCLDILFGGYFQLNSFFGYSALVAGRFAGFGNLTFSVIAISMVISVAILKQIAIEKKINQKRVNLSLITFMIIILLFIGLPYLGSDVGGVLAVTPTIFIAGLMLYGKRINLKSGVYAIVITLVTITMFSIFDLMRPVSERSHLGRFAQLLIHGDVSSIIERKISANITIFSNVLFASLIILITLVAMFLFMHPEHFIKKHRERYPMFAYLAYPGFIVGVLGMLLNDSGVAIPGMMIAIGLPAVMLLSYEIKETKESDATLVDVKY